MKFPNFRLVDAIHTEVAGACCSHVKVCVSQPELMYIDVIACMQMTADRSTAPLPLERRVYQLRLREYAEPSINPYPSSMAASMERI